MRIRACGGPEAILYSVFGAQRSGGVGDFCTAAASCILPNRFGKCGANAGANGTYKI